MFSLMTNSAKFLTRKEISQPNSEILTRSFKWKLKTILHTYLLTEK
jgi:hypothetical protein